MLKFFVSIFLISSLLISSPIDDVVERILYNSSSDDLPLPLALNEELKSVGLLIDLRNKELSDTLDGHDKKLLFSLIENRMEQFKTQLDIKKAPSRHHETVSQLFQKLKNDVAQEGKNIASVTGLTFVALKLCFIADLARIDSTSETEEFNYFMSKKFTDRMGLLFSSEFPDSRSMSFYEFTQTPLRKLKKRVGSLPIIPIISADGGYGVLTYLYAFSRGYLLVGFPIANLADVHGGLLKSFASLYRMSEATNPNYPTDLNKLDFESSLMGMIHDLFHLENLLYLVNPVLLNDLQDKEFTYDHAEIIDARKWVNAFRESYRLLVANWPHDNPEREDTFKAASYLLFWLLHERSMGGIEKISPQQCVDKYVVYEKYTELLSLALERHNFDSSRLSEANLKNRIDILFLSNELDFTKALKMLPSFQELFTHDECEIERQLESVKTVFDKVLVDLPEIFAPLKNAAKLFGDRIEFNIISQPATAQLQELSRYHLNDDEQRMPFVAKIFESNNGFVFKTSSFYPQNSNDFKKYIDKLNEYKMCYIVYIKETESSINQIYNSNTFNKITLFMQESKPFYARIIIVKEHEFKNGALDATLFDEGQKHRGIAKLPTKS